MKSAEVFSIIFDCHAVIKELLLRDMKEDARFAVLHFVLPLLRALPSERIFAHSMATFKQSHIYIFVRLESIRSLDHK